MFADDFLPAQWKALVKKKKKKPYAVERENYGASLKQIQLHTVTFSWKKQLIKIQLNTIQFAYKTCNMAYHVKRQNVDTTILYSHDNMNVFCDSNIGLGIPEHNHSGIHIPTNIILSYIQNFDNKGIITILFIINEIKEKGPLKSVVEHIITSIYRMCKGNSNF